MGGWNGTCAISNLSIRSGDPVYLLLLYRLNLNPGMRGGFCGTIHNYMPMFVPIKGNYNDYGGIENIVEGEHTKALLNYFSKPTNFRVVSREFDKKHQQECHPPFTTTEILINCIERGYLQIKQNISHPSTLFDNNGDVLDTHQCSYFTDWVDVGFMLVHASIFESITKCDETPDFVNDFNELNRSRYKEPVELHEAQIKLAQIYMYGGGHHLELLGYDLDPTSKEFLSLFWLDCAMSGLRKFYSIQGGAGMQGDNYNCHKSLIKVMLKLMKENND